MSENQQFTITGSNVTLRDQFAMAALTGLVAQRIASNEAERACKHHNTDSLYMAYAKSAYGLADAMLAARAAKSEESK